MIPAAIVLILLGVVLGLVAPPFGFAPAVIGIVLVVAALVGIGKRATES